MEQSHARVERNQREPRVFETRGHLAPRELCLTPQTSAQHKTLVDLGQAGIKGVTCAPGDSQGPRFEPVPLAGSESHRQAESCFQDKGGGRRKRPWCWGMSVPGPCSAGQPPVLTHIRQGEGQMLHRTPCVKSPPAHWLLCFQMCFLLIFFRERRRERERKKHR